MNFTPYLYEPDKSKEVYKKTEEFLTQNIEMKSNIEELGWIYHTVGKIIPQSTENFWSGHYFPYIDSSLYFYRIFAAILYCFISLKFLQQNLG